MLTIPVHHTSFGKLKPSDSILHDDGKGHDVHLIVDEVAATAKGTVRLSCWPWHRIGKGRRVIIEEDANVVVAQLPRVDEYIDICNALGNALDQAMRYEKDTEGRDPGDMPVEDGVSIISSEHFVLRVHGRAWRLDFQPAPSPPVVDAEIVEEPF